MVRPVVNNNAWMLTREQEGIVRDSAEKTYPNSNLDPNQDSSNRSPTLESEHDGDQPITHGKATPSQKSQDDQGLSGCSNILDRADSVEIKDRNDTISTVTPQIIEHQTSFLSAASVTCEKMADSKSSASPPDETKPKPWLPAGLNPYYKENNIAIFLGDCREILPHLPKVDLVLTDPPFGVGNFVQVTGRIMGRGDGRGKAVLWNDAKPPPEVFEMLRSISRHRIIFGANFFNCFDDRGGAIVWIKRQSMPNFSKADIASCTHFQKTEVVEIPWNNFTVAHKAESDHPCERPVALYRWCIEYLPYCETILDPFMGSGATLVAAKQLGRKAIGIEIELKYVEIAVRRLAQAVLPLEG